MPLFSIIVPTFNFPALTLEALESVRLQPVDDYELIVVDDGSTDDTPALLAREAASEHWGGRLRVLRNPMRGRARRGILRWSTLAANTAFSSTVTTCSFPGRLTLRPKRSSGPSGHRLLLAEKSHSRRVRSLRLCRANLSSAPVFPTSIHWRVLDPLGQWLPGPI